jgi:hypothetical protein
LRSSSGNTLYFEASRSNSRFISSTFSGILAARSFDCDQSLVVS